MSYNPTCFLCFKVKEEEDVYDGDETEDYWFFVNRWFARGEDDKQIVRELIPTDEQGKPLKGGLEGRVTLLSEIIF